MSLQNHIFGLISSLSSRVFLGPELCREEEWLRVSVNYTISLFGALRKLRPWPRILQPIVHWFMRECRDARFHVKEGRAIIETVLQKRKAEKAIALAQGTPPKRYTDALQWFEDVSKGEPYDPAIYQMSLSIAAIHTTTDLMTQLIYDICEHPDLVEPLRREVVTVLSEGGWTRASLYKMKLMDSVMKESQRRKPISVG